ncbi:MAG: Ca-activated chloride channel family protein [Paracoccaceae bacterium]
MPKVFFEQKRISRLGDLTGGRWPAHSSAMRILFFLLLTALPLQAQQACEVELVLAMDVSRSVDPNEFHLIRHGTAEAFRNPEILELIDWMPGGVLITVTQWSGPGQQRQVIPWQLLTNTEQVRAFADSVDAMKRRFRFDLTAPGEALIHAEEMGRTAPFTCNRRVIDIAGDGIRNTGVDAGETADRIAALGVTINGLVVRGDTPDPLEFYETQIKRGPLAFIEISKGYDDYPRAIFRKLLREMSPNLTLLDVE